VGRSAVLSQKELNEGKDGTPGMNKKGRLNFGEIQRDNGSSDRMCCAMHRHAPSHSPSR
jgi:hypothetical protein